MRPRKKKPDRKKMARVIAEAKRYQDERQKGYRERALAMFPHVCARCGREFSSANLRELTVHHKDLNHDNNPPDGSNWELLCLYCHDEEHQKSARTINHDASTWERHDDSSLDHRPFEGLGNILKNDDG